MKSPHPAESARSAQAQYAPSVPMTVYRELAAELRANKAVIDSLNSRNQQLLQQNQMLKHEIHNVVQATAHLGKAAGIQAPSGMSQGFPSAIAPDTLAKLVRDERQHPEQFDYYEQPEPAFQPPLPVPIAQDRAPRPIERPLTPRPTEQRSVEQRPLENRTLEQRPPENRTLENRAKKNAEKRAAPTAKKVVKKAASATQNRGIDQNLEKIAKRQKAVRQAIQRNEPTQRAPKATQPAPRMKLKVPRKLFTEQVGEHRNAPESEEAKEIGGIWLVLSIILIIVTAFGAGFLIMKPLLGDR